jgi:hypothetical protein
MSKFLVLPVNCPANEFAEKPAMAVLEWTTELRDKIQALQKLVVANELDEIRVRTRFNATWPEHWPDDEDEGAADEAESDMECLHAAVGDAINVLLDDDDEIANKIAFLTDMNGIRGEQLVVTERDWWLASYSKYSDAPFETPALSIDRWESELTPLQVVLDQDRAASMLTKKRDMSPSP